MAGATQFRGGRAEGQLMSVVSETGGMTSLEGGEATRRPEAAFGDQGGAPAARG